MKLIELGWARKDPGVQQMFTSRFMPDGTAEQIASFNEHQRMSCNGLHAAAVVRARAGQDVRPFVPAVRAPTLVLDCAELHVLPGLGHVPIVTARARVAALIDNFGQRASLHA